MHVLKFRCVYVTTGSGRTKGQGLPEFLCGGLGEHCSVPVIFQKFLTKDDELIYHFIINRNHTQSEPVDYIRANSYYKFSCSFTFRQFSAFNHECVVCVCVVLVYTSICCVSLCVCVYIRAQTTRLCACARARQ